MRYLLDVNVVLAGIWQNHPQHPAIFSGNMDPSGPSCGQDQPSNSQEVTDTYLAGLAEEHGMLLATMDSRIKHAAVRLISPDFPIE